MTKRKQLRWRKQPSEKGLAGVCQGPRGAELRYGQVVIARASPKYEGWGRSLLGWYFYAGSEAHGVPHKNTAGDKPFTSLVAAKTAARCYVDKHMKRDA